MGIKKGRLMSSFALGTHHLTLKEEGNTYFGLDSVSQIVIAEVPPPQKGNGGV